MAMDAKDLRAESALAERSSDGGAKFAHTVAALHYDRTKPCQETGSFKVDSQGSRPCAVIGPDRVAPPARDSFPKKTPVEPWLSPDPGYRRPPDYPHKMSEYHDPTRNISPRQTFQENMQRIIMPPGYNAVKLSDDPAYASKNNKLNMPLEAKYCDVPYNVNPINSDQKNIRNADHSVSNVNPLLVRGVPHGWPAGSVNVRPLRPYGAPDVYQYPDYASCTSVRPPLTRPHATGHEEPSHLYPDPYYHEGNIRFKPYPNVKERYPQTRYEYLGNYSNPYHPPHPFATHKYELPKSMPTHSFSGYPPVPLKYSERVSEPVMDGYQRSFNQQGNYGVPFRNPVIHPPYRPVPTNPIQNKLHPFPSDGPNKQSVSNKLPYDSNKMYIDYENSRSKAYPVSDNYYLNETPRSYNAKNPIILPNYPHPNIQGLNPHPYIQLKNYEYARLKGMDPSFMNNPLTRLPMHFSPSTLAISPADSNASNDTTQTHGTSQEDCGYVSQSSMTSVRSIESLNRMPSDSYGRHDYRYGPMVRTSPLSKPDSNCNQVSKSKKDIRQFISSWSEGDDDHAENSSKRDIKTTETHIYTKHYDHVNNQELYVLGSVHVPSEELSKYEHIQKVSKLPENIKGYNNLELLNQFEEAIESSNINKLPMQRELKMPLNSLAQKQDVLLPRPVSPLDVEAKISQSVIHKDVGCNFELKPCSPKMMNVQLAAPVQTILNERAIEKVANPLNIKSPIVLQGVDESMDSMLSNKTIKYPLINTASSCKMINSRLLSETSATDHMKTNYSLQDLESNSGVCLASLPRLDNDIELNFPEVNQQFINANKTESVITTSFAKDLPPLDIERSEENTLENNATSPEFDINYQFSPKSRIETANDFSKLSKYRKQKKNILNDNDTVKAQATRVDSVIIKNPDNARILEENNDHSRSGGFLKKEAQEFAINLASRAKNSQAMLQGKLDNNIPLSNRQEKVGNYPSDFINHPKSDNLLNKSLNIVEASHNNEFDMQSEDLSTTYKDISNRYLEKAALDMPMNLSPQAKYSIIGADEEIKNYKSRDKIKHKDHDSNIKNNRLCAESSHSDHMSQEEPKYKSATFEVFKDSQPKHLNTPQLSDIIAIPKIEQRSITVSSDSSAKCVSTGISTSDNDLHCTEESNLNVSSVGTSTNAVTHGPIPNEPELEIPDVSKIENTQADETNFKAISAVVHKSKRVFSGNGNAQSDQKEPADMLYVPKLKRNKTRTKIPRRKRSTESVSEVVDNDKLDNQNHKPRLSSNNQFEEQVNKPERDSSMKSENVSTFSEKLTESEKQRSRAPTERAEDEKITLPVLLNEEDSKSGNIKGHTLAEIQNKDMLDSNETKESEGACRRTDDNPVNIIEKAKTYDSVDISSEVTGYDPINILVVDKILTVNNVAVDADLGKVTTSDEFKLNEKSEKLKPSLGLDMKEPQNNQNEDVKPLEETEVEEEIQEKEEKNEQEYIRHKLCNETDKINDCHKDISNKEYNNKKSFVLKSYVSKELFSPRIQNLFYNEDSTITRNKGFKTAQIQSTCQKWDKQQQIFSEKYVEPNIDITHKNPSDDHFHFSNDRLEENETSELLRENRQEPSDTNLDNSTEKKSCISSCNDKQVDVELEKYDDTFLKFQSDNEEKVLNMDTDKNTNVEFKDESEECTTSKDAGKTASNCTIMPISTAEEVISKSDGKLSEADSDGQISLEFSTNIKKIVCDTEMGIDNKNMSEAQENLDNFNKLKSNINHIDSNTNKKLYQNFCDRPRFSLKRSLSDSALNAYDDNAEESTETRCLILPKKRKKCYNSSNIDESHLLNIIQNSRRNSISTVYNENNISFCILIDDNCIITEENNFTQVLDDSFHDAHKDSTCQEEKCASPANNNLADEEICSDGYTGDCEEEKSWVEDVGYEEVIETEDIAENIVIGGLASPKDRDSSDYESDDGDTGILSSAAVDHTNKVKHIYGDNMCINDAQLVDALYRTPQMDVNKKLMDRESQITEKATKYYDSDSLEMLLAEPIDNYQQTASESNLKLRKSPSTQIANEHPTEYKESATGCLEIALPLESNCNNLIATINNTGSSKSASRSTVNAKVFNSLVHSCESSLDNVFSYDQKEDSSYTSSSPEVSSTTSEERSSSILLKISNYKGSKISEVKNLTFDKYNEKSCKFTEKDYLNPNYNNTSSTHRPMITKAAQKYIPPLRESIPDLKVKLTLPQQSLLKLKNNKISKEEPKLGIRNVNCSNNNVYPKKELPKKVKPKFEDVLKNIDEVQILKHKEKNKKTRKIIPKVVIKKTENGSHYASTSSKASFNPDLTGRKWQPWVFIEKNQFIDKMALRNKTRAVFSHRKKAFVLDEKFYKYKSISSAKFVISQPKLNDYSTGNLKYTIKLKHSY